MHLVFATRGIQHQVDQWKKHMQCQFFNFTQMDEATKRVMTTGVQGALRPIQLWEYVFPRESLQDVMLNMKIDTAPGTMVNPNLPHLDKYNFLLRKALGLTEVPKLDLNKPGTAQTRYMSVPGVSIHPIGIKDDEVKVIHGENGEKYFQQAL